MADERRLNRALSEICGREHVFAALEDRVLASYDGTGRRGLPAVVARPGTTEEVSAILELASSELVPVYPRGAATGLTGGAVPLMGGIALDLTRMNRIVEIEADDLTALVEPGVVVGDLQREVERRGLLYPPDPASADFCTMGGSVAECAGGLRALKYGVTRDYILGLEVVLASGRVIHTGSGTLKSVSGYDLTRLFVGSEGTLGVFTRIRVRLIPLPAARRTLLALFSDALAAAACAREIVRARILPTALEFLDGATIGAIRKHTAYDMPDGTGAALVIEVDGAECACESEIEMVAAVCGRCGAIETRIASDAEGRERIWSFRRAASPALFSVAPNKINEDICIPPSHAAELIHATQGIAERYRVFIADYGHIGEGNIHVNIMFGQADEARRRAEQAAAEVMRTAIALGGTLSGEHGIGLTKAQFLSLEVAPHEMELMRSLKKLFDPYNILNPGKIFPLDSSGGICDG